MTQEIEVCIKALGTMVMKPQYETNPNEIGSKKYVGNTQMPIVEKEEHRDLILNKLLALVNSIKVA